jgi:hypothetical protein
MYFTLLYVMVGGGGAWQRVNVVTVPLTAVCGTKSQFRSLLT